MINIPNRAGLLQTYRNTKMLEDIRAREKDKIKQFITNCQDEEGLKTLDLLITLVQSKINSGGGDIDRSDFNNVPDFGFPNVDDIALICRHQNSYFTCFTDSNKRTEWTGVTYTKTAGDLKEQIQKKRKHLMDAQKDTLLRSSQRNLTSHLSEMYSQDFTADGINLISLTQQARVVHKSLSDYLVDRFVFPPKFLCTPIEFSNRYNAIDKIIELRLLDQSVLIKLLQNFAQCSRVNFINSNTYESFLMREAQLFKSLCNSDFYVVALQNSKTSQSSLGRNMFGATYPHNDPIHIGNVTGVVLKKPGGQYLHDFLTQKSITIAPWRITSDFSGNEHNAVEHSLAFIYELYTHSSSSSLWKNLSASEQSVIKDLCTPLSTA